MALIRGEQISGSVASASYAVTASYALSSAVSYIIQTGSVSAEVGVNTNLFLIKSASVNLLSITNNATTINSDVFLIKNLANQDILKVSESILYLPTQSAELSNSTAIVGGIYFTSSSFFVGLE